jgi:hypothetical protein
MPTGINMQTWLDENNPPLPDQTFARPAQDCISSTSLLESYQAEKDLHALDTRTIDELKLQALNPNRRIVMATSYGQTFLMCGGIFVLSLVAIWAFWFVEQLRGASAPQIAST